MQKFLDYFGVSRGKSLNSIENRIRTVLDSQNISIIASQRFDQAVHERIRKIKHHQPKQLIDHDAIVVTMLKNEDKKGFVLSTWDKVMIEMVEEITRVYADTPARVIDFLSMAAGEDYECEQSYELMTTLLFMDERIAEPLAKKIAKIRTVEQAYKLDEFIREARQQKGGAWQLGIEDLEPFMESSETLEKQEGN